MRTLVAATPLVCTMLVLSCDSDDYSPGSLPDGGPDTGVIPDPDTILPRVLSLSPSDGEINVSVRTPIQVVFSEAVKLGTTPLTLLANGIPVATSISLSADGTTLTVTPTANIPLPTNMSVNFKDITDLRGNALIRPPWSWTSPLWLPIGTPLDTGGFKLPVIAAGPGEVVTVLSVKNNDSAGYLDLVRNQIAGPTSTWMGRGSLGPTEAGRGAAVVDKDGAFVNAYLAKGNHIAVMRDGVRYPNVPDFPIASTGGVALAVDEHGILFLACDIVWPDGSRHVAATALSRGSEDWTSLGAATVLENDVHLSSLTLDQKGTPYLAYLDSSNNARVRVWRNGSWLPLGSPLNIESEQVTDLAIALDSSANVYALVSFADRFLPRYRVQILRFDGTSWIACGPEISEDKLDGVIFFARMGNDHIFAYFGTSPNVEVLDVTRNGWTRIPPPAMARLSARLSGGMGAIDPEGVPVIAWEHSTSGELQVVRLNR
ncbi:Ig-like domain-containing protein [Pendulispora brunnea]|uniref:Ig-like domain-containing protein n=1 Tax=Pendulispora brunnea TaxID=2905690 RepID=A0ABZ2K4M5_9BACT